MLLLIQEPKSIEILQKVERSETIIIDDSDCITISIIRAIFSPKDNISVTRYNPSKSRNHFWQNIFGLEPLPAAVVPNAAELFAGSLSQDRDVTYVDIQTAIDEADEN